MAPGHYVTIHVADTGAGMDEETRSRIFEPFFSTKGRGSGIGLAVVHRIVTEHGGTLRASSRPGQGTTFRLELKASRAHEPEGI